SGTSAKMASSFGFATARLLGIEVAVAPSGAQSIPPLSVALASLRRGVVPVLRRSPGVVQPLPLLIVRPGKTLVRQGESSGGAWRIETGILRASVLTPDGRELVMDLLGPGDVAGDPVGSPATWTVEALRPARLRSVDDDALLEALASRIAR